jgi:hypothetical protein
MLGPCFFQTVHRMLERIPRKTAFIYEETPKRLSKSFRLLFVSLKKLIFQYYELSLNKFIADQNISCLLYADKGILINKIKIEKLLALISFCKHQIDDETMTTVELFHIKFKKKILALSVDAAKPRPMPIWGSIIKLRYL